MEIGDLIKGWFLIYMACGLALVVSIVFRRYSSTLITPLPRSYYHVRHLLP